ncbi:MAG TPA: protein kinase [Candidatus Acidoferrales bacterium]|nr:protein kinase [Candidatus Acidoferrales bacterium]
MPEQEQEQEMEIAHVLALEIVDFGGLPINEQTTALQDLASVVNATPAVQSAQKNQQLISLVSGEGMSLAFFGSPEGPLRCAIAITNEAKLKARFRLRIGIHSGPVFRIRDTQGRENVAGGGVTMAQRVMNCGDPGHILLSAGIADVLVEHTRWKPFLTDLGMTEVKAGSTVRLYNFKNDEAGNAHLPRSIRAGLSSASWRSARASQGAASPGSGHGSGAPAVPAVKTPPPFSGTPSGIPPSDPLSASMTQSASMNFGGALSEYEILGELGAGGIGKVYKARHRISQRMEALKVLQQDQLGTPEMVERFVREIRVLASLNHPNIAALHTAIRHEDRLVMVMEYVEGVALSDHIAGGRVTIPQAAEYMRQVLHALVYAHERGVIHRDIKPSNMMIVGGAQPVAKLLDFGLAVSGRDPSFTASGTIMGSLYYMSPEQVRGERVDARSDLYSLGVTLYEIVSGRRPFDGRSQYEILDGHLRQQPVPPTDLNPNLPMRLSAIILKALVKDAGARFQSAQEFLRALETYLLESGAAPSVAIPGAHTTPLPGPPTPPPARPQSERIDGSVSWITPPVVQEVAKKLAEFIGPIAHIIAQRTAARCNSVDELYSAVALEIESGQDRAKFLASRKKK